MENKAAPINVNLDKNYDSDFCGSIPLHLVNLIQPHGALLVVGKNDLQIAQASENVAHYLKMPIDELLEKPLSDFISAKQFKELLSKMERQQHHVKIPFDLTFQVSGEAKAFMALVHPKEEYILIELEPNVEATKKSFAGLYQHIKYITNLLKQAADTSEAAQLAAVELKHLSGFDRVLVYQFDPTWNGIVIAQAKEDDMDDYMDLRFPASDVPRQARDLYYRNPYRLIPTREYTPVGLIPIVNPVTQRFTDLSDCNLRSVAVVHLEYLANLKITASMSLPLIVDNKLWGLISCHHKTAKNPDYEERSAMELLAGILSAQISGKEKEKGILLRAQLRGVHAHLLEQLYNQAGFIDGLLSGSTTIMDLLSVTGAAVLYEGNIVTIGSTPSKQELKELASWLRRNKSEQVIATNSLAAEYVQSKAYKDVASGLIALPIHAEHGEYVFGFRPEVLQTVTWGGNPNDAIQIEADGKSYHPRNSFASYQETVKFTALPWEDEELEAAAVLRSAVLEKILKEKY
ncbi:GAF domain-containing protein [Pontibacter oryzae]|uniref:GAF domain-containing protein n=1 Tax=Pontibacter oryzae TaxID=2304593 RepID=A0A399SGT3_9BACT|nr:GAF domain-containing protein [Pontibacter oryzae]RIJ42029.1 GAF domain-containing protein [Pontibacter oryzae]